MNTGSAILPLGCDRLWQLPLTKVMRAEIAQLLQTLRLSTVGDFLSGWCDPQWRRVIEQAFDEPRQARQAAATCASWLGVPASADCCRVPVWWCQGPDLPAMPDPPRTAPARARTWWQSQVLGAGGVNGRA